MGISPFCKHSHLKNDGAHIGATATLTRNLAAQTSHAAAY